MRYMPFGRNNPSMPHIRPKTVFFLYTYRPIVKAKYRKGDFLHESGGT